MPNYSPQSPYQVADHSWDALLGRCQQQNQYSVINLVITNYGWVHTQPGSTGVAAWLHMCSMLFCQKYATLRGFVAA